MRSLITALLLLFPGILPAQDKGHVPLRHHRPAFATSGVETMPQMAIDELALSQSRFDSYTLPMKFWNEMKECAAMAGYDTTRVGLPPVVLVVPAARTIRVHDLAVDSAYYAEDSDFKGEHWSSPTVAYALTRSNAVVVTEAYRLNKYVLRHEALHFIVWRSEGRLGHPVKAFKPCDAEYE